MCFADATATVDDVSAECGRAVRGGRLAARALALALTAAGSAAAADPSILPPELPWSGRSESLVVAANDPWVTPSERSGVTATPRYPETVDWLRRLAAASSLDLRVRGTGRAVEQRPSPGTILEGENPLVTVRFQPVGEG